MLTSLISLPPGNTPPPNLLPKTSVPYAKNYGFIQSFPRSQPYWPREISQTSGLKSTTETFSGNTQFIHVDGFCNYLHSFQTQSTANFFKKNCCFLDQENVGRYINKATETGLDFFIKYLLRAI